MISELIHTVFIGGDGNFRLRRNNKGGGEKTDPSLFGDDGFYAPNEAFKSFCSVRGDDIVDKAVSYINVCDGAFLTSFKEGTCKMRAGSGSVTVRSFNKPTSGVVSTSCARSGAFFPKGTVDMRMGEK